MFNLPHIEEKILKFWNDNKIFEKSLEKESLKGEFIFYEGPPTANGKPGIHHVLARVFKDLIPRYKTMRGFQVKRKAGWDTHGLPVELEVEKQLKLSNKKDIENYGIEKFNQKCKESVWKYKEDWEKMTERIGFWLDMKNPYITYENNYIESLWWIIKQAAEKGLLYQGHKVIPQCPRCGTALSSHEVAQGYKNVTEESLTVKFQIINSKFQIPNSKTYIFVWTTTPWTLPGNVALAVGEKIDYLIVKNKDSNEVYILAKDRMPNVLKCYPEEKSNYEFIKEIKGKDLVGLKYEPLFPGVITEKDNNYQNAFKVYAADFVSTEEGTGVVHTAVMYGQEDYELGEKIGLPKVHTVNLDGTFNELAPKWQGRLVIDKKVKEEIIQDLKDRGLLFKTESYTHDYPFCWRCDTPLVYYAKDSWYFKMSALREQLIKNNATINWLPAHIKEGRFGEWLREIKDWAISRERYWGTPIPVWICEQCGDRKVIGSYEELEKSSGKKIDDPHRPFIDEIIFKCGQCAGEMRRIPEVMDCWFDSGAMPFAQAHYPFENREKIDEIRYPANFICEAIDQTRGWFYTVLAVATLLGKEAPYKNVICLGHILDKKGQKMSKHIGNVIDPWQMIDKYGADAVRWYLYTVNQAGEPKRFDEQALKESSRMFITLINVLNFYQMFGAGIKVEDMEDKDLSNILDRWITAKLTLLTKEITDCLEKYDIFTAARKIDEFINELSAWYIRRSRERFKGADDSDKLRALKTLRWVLCHLARLMAPFTPFTAEYIYQTMGADIESVHLKEWPEIKEKWLDQKVLNYMAVVRKIVELGLAQRAEVGIKVRQPLAKSKIKNQKLKLKDEYLSLIKDELNVKEVIFEAGDEDLEVELDTAMTDELKEEGILRELIRTINGMRKKMKLTIQDRVVVEYNSADKTIRAVFTEKGNELKKSVLASELKLVAQNLEKIKINDIEIGIKILKI